VLGVNIRLPLKTRQLLDFLAEAERLKHVERRIDVTGHGRPENSAEHSWHAALMAMLLAREMPKKMDRDRAIRMLLIHDLVEIYAGDTFHYDRRAKVGQGAREERAARKLFSKLKGAEGREVRALWQEFTKGRTLEARFARSCDMLQAVLQNICCAGRCWRRYGVSLEDVRKYNESAVERGSRLHAVFEYLMGLVARHRLVPSRS
jgi:putative hydrolase of HD superfamily